ncbi:hypothetical protein L211DRAFT_95565 [Terfezia boudieri ATCC MYA-4762]|uniref:BTB domain-containing protein n=1 Tax=Terfezia boudieri ATCC MYA-4762 TaxID=1051890 RepID=A0A3N4LVR3_9PEZI|nr:hypothetical protein L211DRAFT_95565 [Terfezia boudieri ATCC MYA-4762]
MAEADFDFSMFQGGSFTIVLADPGDSSSDSITESPLETGPAAESSSLAPQKSKHLPEYLIHRSLLASVSPELAKHTNNDMKEGKEGRMILHEVNATTIERFLQWAYKGHYTVAQSGVLALSIHTHIYAFAERFNIPVLKDEAYKKANQRLKALNGYPRPSDEETMEIANVFDYAFTNLPVQTDLLLKDYAQYMAWDLEILRKKDCFLNLLMDNPEVGGAVIQCVRRASRPPWNKVVQHALLRYCMVCLRPEVADIVCPGCLKRASGVKCYISGSREEYTVGLLDSQNNQCCSKGKGTYRMHEHLVCQYSACKGTGGNGGLSYPD